MVVKKKKLAPAFVAVVSRQELKHALSVLRIVIPSRSVRPMLEYVVLQFEPGQLKFTGSNLDVTLCACVSAKVTDRARVLVPLREFATLVQSGADEVTLSVGAESVTVQNGSGKAKLPLGDVSEYPDLTLGQWSKLGDTRVEIETKGLASRLDFVRRAQSTNADEKRYAMGGVLMAIEGGSELVFVTTDGKRMHMTSTDLCSGVVGNAVQATLLSPVAAQALSKLLPKKGDGRLTVQFPPLAERTKGQPSLYCGGHGGVALLSCGAFTLLDRTVDGEFPSYQRVIPASVKTEVTVDADAVVAAIEQVEGVCTPDARAVRLSPDIEAQVVNVSAGSRHGSQAESAFGFERGHGDKAHDFALNPDYLRDAVAGRDQVRFGWNEKNQPVRLDGSDDCLAVIMPITLDS